MSHHRGVQYIVFIVIRISVARIYSANYCLFQLPSVFKGATESDISSRICNRKEPALVGSHTYTCLLSLTCHICLFSHTKSQNMYYLNFLKTSWIIFVGPQPCLLRLGPKEKMHHHIITVCTHNHILSIHLPLVYIDCEQDLIGIYSPSFVC